MAAALLAACGPVQAPEIGDDPGDQPGADPGDEPGAVAGEDPGGDPAVAPECFDVEPLDASLPADTEPTGTDPEPATTSDPGTEPAPPPDAVDLGQEIEAWVAREAADSFAGLWIDHDLGGYAVAFTDDVDDHAQRLRAEVHPGLAVAEATHTEDELRDIQDRLAQEQLGGDGERGEIRGVGAQITINRTTVGIYHPDDERLAELSDAYGATAICFEIEDPPEAPGEAVTTLAKAQGWRDGLAEETGGSFAVLEVAGDRASAEVAWADNVPADLPSRDDELPAEPGVYGDLDAVDLDRQVIVVWSSGESGSCPGWLADLDTADGVITVERGATAAMCTDDYNPYRLVLAVDRDRLPDLDALDTAVLDGVPDGEVRPYPTDAP